MFRRRVPFSQIAFATLLGVVGGLYIYKPFFESQLQIQRPRQHNQEVPNPPELNISSPESRSPDPSDAITLSGSTEQVVKE